MISPCENSRSQAAGLGFVLDQHLQPALHPALQYEVQNALDHKVSISFQVHFPSSCRAGPFRALWRLVSSYCMEAVTIASCWQEPKQLEVAAQPINPHHSKPPLQSEHHMSHPFPQRP